MKKKIGLIFAVFLLSVAAIAAFADEMEVVDLEEFLDAEEIVDEDNSKSVKQNQSEIKMLSEKITGDAEIDLLLSNAKVVHDIFYDKDSAKVSKDERFLYYMEYTDTLSQVEDLAKKKYGKESFELVQLYAEEGTYFFGETLKLLDAYKIFEKLKGRVEVKKELNLAIKIGDGLAANFREQAEKCYLRAEELFTNGKITDYPLLAKIYNSLGELSTDKDKTINYLTKAKNLAEKNIKENGQEQKPDQIAILGSALGGMGKTYGEVGDYEKELLYYEEALRVLEENKREKMLPQILARLGLLYANKGDYKKAESYLVRGLEIAENASVEIIDGKSAVTGKFKSGEYSDDAYECQKALGIIYKQQKRFNEAKTHFDKMQVIAMLQGKTDYEVDFFLNSAELHEEKGEYEKASKNYATAQELIVKMYGEDSPKLGDVFRRCSYFYERRGDFLKAEKYFMEELRVLQNSSEYSGILKSCWTNIKEKIVAKKWNWNPLIEKSFQTATAAVERLRTSPTAGSIKNKMLGMASPFYYIGIDTELKKAGGAISKAFDFSESVRSRGFLDQVGTEAALSLPGISSDDANAVRLIDEKITAAREELSTNLFKEVKNRDKNRMSELAKEIEENQTALQSLEQKMSAQNPMFAQLRNPKPATLADAQNFCGDDKAVVEFILWDETFANTINKLVRNDSPMKLNSYAIAVTKEKTFFVRLDDFDYEDAVNSLRAKLLNYDSLPEEEFEQERNDLYKKLFGGVLEKLPKNIKSLLIVPDGSLAFLPFDILRESATSPELGANYEISFSPSVSISVLKAAQKIDSDSTEKMRANISGMLAMGGGWYNSQQSVAEHRGNYSIKQRGGKSRGGKVGSRGFGGGQAKEVVPTISDLAEEEIRDFIKEKGAGAYFLERGLVWDDLPGTLTEVEELKKSSLSKNSFKIIKQNLVTEEKVKSLSKNGNLAEYSQLHFACHGYFDSKIPELCGVVFSEVSKKDAVEDGYLTVPEILQLKMNADYVCLSACETGLGRIKVGDGLTGLSRAFMVAGSKKVGVTLWCVNDEATCQFMIQLYKKVAEGKSYSQAYFETRGEFRNGENVEWRHPYYRAAFVLYE